jgi:hypothetical protein
MMPSAIRKPDEASQKNIRENKWPAARYPADSALPSLPHAPSQFARYLAITEIL